jgi:hypothetical protein
MHVNDPGDESALQTKGSAGRKARIVALFCTPLLAAILYMCCLPAFVRWEERATTNPEWFRRAQLRNRFYAPVIWLKAHDPSGTVRALVQWEYGIGHNQSFDPGRLP